MNSENQIVWRRIRNKFVKGADMETLTSRTFKAVLGNRFWKMKLILEPMKISLKFFKQLAGQDNIDWTT